LDALFSNAPHLAGSAVASGAGFVHFMVMADHDVAASSPAALSDASARSIKDRSASERDGILGCERRQSSRRS
jgi:hypothetical protein